MLALQLIGLAGAVLLLTSMVSGSRLPSDTAWRRAPSAGQRRSTDR